jgi:5-methylcytosine-specific restriction enzyme A
MTSKAQVEPLPATGPLSIGSVYRRAELNARFGGNRYAGIVPSKREPVILLFHTEEPAQQFYRDGFDENGVYWYSGEGSEGNMTWTPANRAVRDHAELGFDLLFFERVQRKDGLWQFAHILFYFTFKQEQRIDRTGKERSAIIFGLLQAASDIADTPQTSSSADLASLRAAATRTVLESGVKTAIRNIYLRSNAVRRYVLRRSKGLCEACGSDAPFKGDAGEPFLEVHHIDRLADSGPDSIDRVAAVCPNCHRRCHYSEDRAQYNLVLRNKIGDMERRAEGENNSGSSA